MSRTGRESADVDVRKFEPILTNYPANGDNAICKIEDSYGTDRLVVARAPLDKLGKG